jgi:hypothetical protein
MDKEYKDNFRSKAARNIQSKLLNDYSKSKNISIAIIIKKIEKKYAIRS